MSVHDPFLRLLQETPGVSQPDARPDFLNGVGSNVVRCVYQGQRAVAVHVDKTKTRVGALLDLVDLHLHGEDEAGGTPVAPDEVTILLADDRWDTEAEGALRTLAAHLDAKFHINLRRLTSQCEVLPISAAPLDDLGDHRKYRYTRWRELLDRVADRPPTLVEAVLDAVPRDELRAYPMLSRNGYWSLRLEGLEVARIGADRGSLEVGKDRDGQPGPERDTWLSVVPSRRLTVVEEPASIAAAADAIERFAQAWGTAAAQHGRQNEHALESRVLRGCVPITTSAGQLELLPAPSPARVNWGSQFPTRWGITNASSGRYLDALLRDGAVPWALEMKVDGPASVGQYYRHAVAQAVLYREFIRRATHLSSWFERFGLDHTASQAAVVVPEFRPEQARWASRLSGVCEVFDVELITVPERFAKGGPCG